MILCCGEALIDMIPAPLAQGGEGFAPHLGGSVFNTAIALGRLGAPVGMMTGLSRDLFGRRLEASLRESGVETATLAHADLPTTLAFVELDDGQASYSFYDENTAGRMLRIEDIPPTPAETRTLYFGGISLAVEPCADAYAALLDRDGGGRAVMLDPNIRPGFAQDETRFRDRLAGMIAAADIVKVSDEDLDWLRPGPGALSDKMAALQAEGPAIVLVTRGGEGALARLPGGEEISVPSRRVEVVDTVGAGDSFNAGVLTRLNALGLLSKPALREIGADAMREALEHGALVASVVVSRSGANPPWAAELD